MTETPNRVPHRDSADVVLSGRQRRVILTCLATFVGVPTLAQMGLLPHAVGPRTALCSVVAVLTGCYFLIIGYKSSVMWAASRAAKTASAPRISAEPDAEYTILVPLYKEAAVLAQLVANIAALDYPRHLLQVLLLVEDDDEETIAGVRSIDLPDYMKMVLIPESFPRTKPKACNVGLQHATGEFCVIYDAEDRPDPLQLRKAVAAFSSAPRRTVCLQSELQYFNPATNGLTRWFAAEYALNFSYVLPGLVRLQAPVPLGGTSNHFRTEALRELGGWDGFNVTEDADLGMWIARHGMQVGVIDSVTWEEANSRLGNWVRQRSRWIKGYIQTYLVHMRHPVTLFRELGPAGFLSFQCVIGGTSLTLLVNPLFWSLTTAYVVFDQQWVRDLFPAPVFYLGIISMVLGNFLSMWYLMLACIKRELFPSVRWVLAIPMYWFFMSVAAIKAASQLANPRLRHHWEKTTHGLVTEFQPATTPAAAVLPAPVQIPAGTATGRAAMVALQHGPFVNR